MTRASHISFDGSVFMTRKRVYIASLMALALLVQLAAAGASKPAKKIHSSTPARIHYSANIIGDLEPCG